MVGDCTKSSENKNPKADVNFFRGPVNLGHRIFQNWLNGSDRSKELPKNQWIDLKQTLKMVLIFCTLTTSICATNGEMYGQQRTEEVLVDRLVAVVNGEPLAYSEVMEKVKKGPLVSVVAYPAKNTDSQFEIALQDLINFKLIMQKSVELDLDIGDEQLLSEIEQFVARRNLTMEGLQSALFQQGISFEEYKKDFRNQMILNKFQGRVILPTVKVSDKDIEVYYLETSGNKLENVQLTLRQLFIDLRPDLGESVVKGKRELANRVHKELMEGMSFEKAVKIYSDSANAQQGGLMPPLYLKDMARVFQKAIKPLKEGEFSEPVAIASGIYFFYLEKRSFAGSEDYKKRKSKLSFDLRRLEVGKQTIKWLKDQRRKSKIMIIR